mmetsp:Transcript_13994/g.28678  ORF Transcript_13994/g.28678 Transcript_13994/m.28678 type:complete len:266 (-) Transcript_13994:1346-2143(-)
MLCSAFSMRGSLSSSTLNLSMVFCLAILHCSHSSIARRSSFFSSSLRGWRTTHVLNMTISGHLSRMLPNSHSSKPTIAFDPSPSFILLYFAATGSEVKDQGSTTEYIPQTIPNVRAKSVPKLCMAPSPFQSAGFAYFILSSNSLWNEPISLGSPKRSILFSASPWVKSFIFPFSLTTLLSQSSILFFLRISKPLPSLPMTNILGSIGSFTTAGTFIMPSFVSSMFNTPASSTFTHPLLGTFPSHASKRLCSWSDVDIFPSMREKM